MSLLTRSNPLQIVTPRHITPYLKQEVEALGYPIVEATAMGLETKGTMQDAMRLNLHLRTAHRVLFFLDEFRADSVEDLYDELRSYDWENYIPVDGYLSVNSYVEHPSVTDSRYPNLKAKDAIVDRIHAKRGRRPDSGPDRTGTVVYLYWTNGRCRLYFDTSGENLANRGYREIPFQAPLQESLAAAILHAANWQPQENLVHPMCGSGTLAIEAALLAMDFAPGLIRENFGFMHLRGYQPEVWDDLRHEARARILKRPPARILATDHDPEAIRAARRNASWAGVAQFLEFQRCDFKETPIPPAPGVLIVNPGYGERIGDPEELEGLYRDLGSFLKHQCPGYRGYILTGNPDLAKVIGLKAKRKIPFFNTQIECRLLEFELYAGTRKASKQPDP